MQKHWSELATVNVTIKLVGLLNKAKKRLFNGSPLPPAPNFWKLEKKFLLYKNIPPLIFRIPKKVFFFLFENFDPLKIFLSCCYQLVYILMLV